MIGWLATGVFASSYLFRQPVMLRRISKPGLSGRLPLSTISRPIRGQEREVQWSHPACPVYYIPQLAEGHLTPSLFGQILAGASSDSRGTRRELAIAPEGRTGMSSRERRGGGVFGRHGRSDQTRKQRAAGVARIAAVDVLGSVDEMTDGTGTSVDAAVGADMGPYRKSRLRRRRTWVHIGNPG